MADVLTPVAVPFISIILLHADKKLFQHTLKGVLQQIGTNQPIKQGRELRSATVFRAGIN